MLVETDSGRSPGENRASRPMVSSGHPAGGRGERVSPDVLAAAIAKAMRCLRDCGPLRSGHDTGANSWPVETMICHELGLLLRLSKKQPVAGTPAQRACPEFRRTSAGAAKVIALSLRLSLPELSTEVLTLHQAPQWM